MNFVQNMYQSIKGIEEPEDIARHLIMKLTEISQCLHENVDYKEARGKRIFELERDLKENTTKEKH